MGRWVKPEVYPLIGAMTFVTGMCVFQLTRNVLLNPAVRIDKSHRKTAVLENQEEGEKYAEHGFPAFDGSQCVRSIATDLFNLVNNSLPFNKYVFLTTHNAFAIDDGLPRLTFTNQEDNVTQQLNVPAINTLREIESFLSSNPSEIVTIILEDYVETPNGLTKVFTDAGLMKYWFPLSKMPKKGQDWPLVKEMVTNNQRLIVFTSKESKENSEGIAYQWNYMVENQYGDGGMKAGECFNRAESSALNDTSKALVLINYFRSVPIKPLACVQNSGDLGDMIQTCYATAGNRWANFVAVDYYKRSEGGGAFKATDTSSGELLCGCNDVHSCATVRPVLLHNDNLFKVNGTDSSN
ncbi:hypothetical protein RD792_001458 [Penstemon davidsonii]|uniref:Uncharacterized protein n=1 Tax=Penstemon davidsonii TaxID=160366 RepID=A0ABR0DNF5_9LAMI|nr:hypothetical protein RD792_001458 [Penstemon davidsonii]